MRVTVQDDGLIERFLYTGKGNTSGLDDTPVDKILITMKRKIN